MLNRSWIHTYIRTIHRYICVLYIQVSMHTQIYTSIQIYMHACIARIIKNNHRSIIYYSEILEISESTSRRKINCAMPMRESHIAVKRNTPELHESIPINPISTLLIRWKQCIGEHLQYDSLMNTPCMRKKSEKRKGRQERIQMNSQALKTGWVGHAVNPSTHIKN